MLAERAARHAVPMFDDNRCSSISAAADGCTAAGDVVSGPDANRREPARAS